MGLLVVGRHRADGPRLRWAALVGHSARARGTGVGRAVRAVGHTGGFGFPFSSELTNVYSI